MLARLGTAFVLLGVIVLNVFLLSLSVEQANLWMLVAGSLLAALGLFLRRRYGVKPTRAPRFELIRRLFGKRDNGGS